MAGQAFVAMISLMLCSLNKLFHVYSGFQAGYHASYR